MEPARENPIRRHISRWDQPAVPNPGNLVHYLNQIQPWDQPAVPDPGNLVRNLNQIQPWDQPEVPAPGNLVRYLYQNHNPEEDVYDNPNQTGNMNPDLKDRFGYLVPGMFTCDHLFVRKGQNSSKRYSHRVLFKDDGFSVDESSYRKVHDPANASFLESIKNARCPDEFEGEGIHYICLMRAADKDWDELEGEVSQVSFMPPPPNISQLIM